MITIEDIGKEVASLNAASGKYYVIDVIDDTLILRKDFEDVFSSPDIELFFAYVSLLKNIYLIKK